MPRKPHKLPQQPQRAQARVQALRQAIAWLQEPPSPPQDTCCTRCQTHYDGHALARCPQCGDYNTPF